MSIKLSNERRGNLWKFGLPKKTQSERNMTSQSATWVNAAEIFKLHWLMDSRPNFVKGFPQTQTL